ncbi:hypothetical protein AVEN_52355-1 [Araneus ventricosus]|uniref:Uncharacterized protein n=1 Tax=Araneus ventricosus TaxID=182803 RepID=A0A4Y2ISP8_ARAVE|nr:hypothetical protein AVEN_52355-1 [Araneus ventricosus]
MTGTTPDVVPPSLRFLTTPAGGCFPTTDLACTMSTGTAELQWNRVSNLEPSGYESRSLSLGHHGPKNQFRACSCESSQGKIANDLRLMTVGQIMVILLSHAIFLNEFLAERLLRPVT